MRRETKLALDLLRGNPAYQADARQGAPLNNSVVGSLLSIQWHIPRQIAESGVRQALSLLDAELDDQDEGDACGDGAPPLPPAAPDVLAWSQEQTTSRLQEELRQTVAAMVEHAERAFQVAQLLEQRGADCRVFDPSLVTRLETVLAGWHRCREVLDADECEEFILPRTGQPPLTFSGKLLAEVTGSWHNGKQHNRWHDLYLYQCVSGQYVVRISFCTCWQGELERDFVHVLDQAAFVANTLRDHDPLTAVPNPYPQGQGYEEIHRKQELVRSNVRARYEARVQELLASRPELAERLA